jgi:hypothetical protein
MSHNASSAFLTALAAAAITLTTVQLTYADDTQRVRVRGTVETLNGETLTIKTRDGADQAIALKSGWKIGGIKRASVDDIKPGDFVGVGSMPKGSGPNDAIQVMIFPAAMRGTGEGNRPWDAQPNTEMTNATVSNAVKAVNGRTITLTYQGKEKTIAIPDGTQIVTLASAAKDDLKPGADVIVTAQKSADGSMSSAQVAVGLDGVSPM